MKFKYLVFFGIFTFIYSCVPISVLQEKNAQLKKCNEENYNLLKEKEKLEVDSKEFKSKYYLCDSLRKKIENEKLEAIKNKNLCEEKYLQLERKYNELDQSYKSLKQGSTYETQRLIDKLQKSQESLLEKEEQLNILSASLEEKRKNLDALSKELEKRNARLAELEKILQRKDSTVMALKKKVSDALLGFEGQGLSVNIKNGKVYVSMEDKLLFKSGSTDIDEKGIIALKRLARILEQNPDINIMVEGHTDDVPVLKGSRFQDNWDLSVLRATSVIRVILENSKIDPKRITAAGRGEYLPIDPRKTPDARQKNRRTEIILTPKLDELFKILETN